MDDVDMNDNFVVNIIIYNNCNNYNEVGGCTLVPSTNSSCSFLCSSSNMSKKVYTEQIQRESDKIVQDEPTVSSDSIQLEYTTQEVQSSIVSKAAEPLLTQELNVGTILLQHVSMLLQSNQLWSLWPIILTSSISN